MLRFELALLQPPGAIAPGQAKSTPLLPICAHITLFGLAPIAADQSQSKHFENLIGRTQTKIYWWVFNSVYKQAGKSIFC